MTRTYNLSNLKGLSVNYDALDALRADLKYYGLPLALADFDRPADTCGRDNYGAWKQWQNEYQMWTVIADDFD